MAGWVYGALPSSRLACVLCIGLRLAERVCDQDHLMVRTSQSQSALDRSSGLTPIVGAGKTVISLLR